MANHTTGAQRYNNRMDKIWERAKQLESIQSHTLNIISLHDAKADCKCGWYYVYTGELSREQIREEYQKHILA